ncbi:MAG: DUF2905 domain-containing protein [Gammaproteobacteria bacterium]|nr:DUF2905 domain-containing protein [Gammaproteobacteria bacterium]
MGKWLVFAGLLLVLAGLLIQYAPWTVNWFGRLPGDIRIESENGRAFIPLTSMILVSIVLTVIVNLLRR